MNYTALTTIAGLALLVTSSAAAQGTDARHDLQDIGFALPTVAVQDTTHARSSVRGLSFGIHGATTALPRRNTLSGSGLSLAIGYGVTDRLAFQASTSGARIGASGNRDSFFQSHVDIEGRYSFGRMNDQWMPHLAIGVSGRTAHDDRSLEQGGGTGVGMTVGPTAGGGVSYSLSPSTALDASVRYTFRDATRTRVFLGVSWFPHAR